MCYFTHPKHQVRNGWINPTKSHNDAWCSVHYKYHVLTAIVPCFLLACCDGVLLVGVSRGFLGVPEDYNSHGDAGDQLTNYMKVHQNLSSSWRAACLWNVCNTLSRMVWSGVVLCAVTAIALTLHISGNISLILMSGRMSVYRPSDSNMGCVTNVRCSRV